MLVGKLFLSKDFNLIDHRRLPALVGLTPHCKELVIDIRRADRIEALAAETISSTPTKDMANHLRHSIELIEADVPVVVQHCPYSMVTLSDLASLKFQPTSDPSDSLRR